MPNYVFKRFTDDYYRLINQTGVKQAVPKEEGNEKFNTCWDGAVSPDGQFYFSLSSFSIGSRLVSKNDRGTLVLDR